MRRIWHICCIFFSVSVVSWLPSAAGGEEPSALLQTPITLHISACLLDASSQTLLSSSIQPSDFSRFYLRSPPLTRSFLTPLSSAPKMIKKQTQQPWCPGSTLQLDHALCSFTEGKKKISTSQKDQTDAKPLWCDNFNFDGCRLCKSPLLKSK